MSIKFNESSFVKLSSEYGHRLLFDYEDSLAVTIGPIFPKKEFFLDEDGKKNVKFIIQNSDKISQKESDIIKNYEEKLMRKYFKSKKRLESAGSKAKDSLIFLNHFDYILLRKENIQLVNNKPYLTAWGVNWKKIPSLKDVDIYNKEDWPKGIDPPPMPPELWWKIVIGTIAMLVLIVVLIIFNNLF